MCSSDLSVPASQPAPSPRRTKALEAAARKKKDGAPSQLVLRERRSKSAADVDASTERRSKSAADVDADTVPRKQRGAFQRQRVLPAKKRASTPSRPTTAGLTPAGKLTVEERADAIVAEARAEGDARMAEGTGVPAGGAGDEVIGPALGGDFIYDLNPGDLEREFYARTAQAVLALGASDADLTVEQLLTAKEDEESMKAEAAAAEAAKAKSEQVVEPASPHPPLRSTAAPQLDQHQMLPRTKPPASTEHKIPSPSHPDSNHK